MGSHPTTGHTFITQLMLLSLLACDAACMLSRVVCSSCCCWHCLRMPMMLLACLLSPVVRSSVRPPPQLRPPCRCLPMMPLACLLSPVVRSSVRMISTASTVPSRSLPPANLTWSPTTKGRLRKMLTPAGEQHKQYASQGQHRHNVCESLSIIRCGRTSLLCLR
jgi:hypothetical protein